MVEDLDSDLESDSANAAQYGAEVIQRDKELRRKSENPTRAELYRILMAYFTTHDRSNLQYFSNDISKEFYDEFCRDTPPYKGVQKRIHKRKQIQDLVLYIFEKFEIGWIQSLCVSMELANTVKKAEKCKWATYRMTLKGKKTNSPFNDLTRRELLKQVEQNVVLSLDNYKKRLGEGAAVYAHFKGFDRFGFVGIGTHDGTQLKNSVVFAFTPGTAFLYYHGQNYPNMAKIITNALGFDSCQKHDLRDVGLTAVYQTCIRTVKNCDLNDIQDLKRRFEAEEEEMSERGVRFLHPAGERKTKYICSFLEDGQPRGVSSFTFIHQIPVSSDTNSQPSTSATAHQSTKHNDFSVKITVKDGSPDSYIAELYRCGFLKDITPYLDMKKNHTNSIVLKH